MSLVRRIADAMRLGLFRAFGGAAARLEPRGDVRHMARQFERGELVWRAFVDAGSALRRAGRFDEADAMVERGLAVFAGDRTLLYEHAFSAHAAGRYAVAIERWEKALAAAPDLAMCHAGLAANLRETGALDRATTTIEGAMARFPDDLTVITEAARIADRGLRFDRSLPLWRRAAAAPQPAPEWIQGEIHALVRLARFPEAEAALFAARPRFPQHPGLMAVEGILAEERREWPRALAIWSAYRQQFPDDDTGRDGLERARIAGEAAAEGRAIAHRDAATLLSRFASLGDGAEFEILQDRHGAGRETSLHWSQVGFEGLLAALAASFEGLGEAANTSVTVDADGHVLATDRRWRLSWRSTGTTEPTPDTMRHALAATRDALLADFAAGHRIAVYRSTGLDPQRIEVLHRALLRLGPVRLLVVQPAAPTAPSEFAGAAGDIVEIEPGRYVGFLERLGAADGHGVWDIATADWVAACKKVARAAPPR